MNSVPAILTEDPKELQAIILELHRKLIEAKAHFDRETGILIEQIRLLRQQMFGRKSEKFSSIPSNVHIQPLFDWLCPMFLYTVSFHGTPHGH